VDVTPLMQQLPQAAYFYGWIHSNGSIYIPTDGTAQLLTATTNKHVYVTGTETDVTTLQQLANYFHVTPTVIKERNRYVLRIRNKEFANACMECGLTWKKGQRGEVSKWLATSPDFWRGVFDSSSLYVADDDEVHIHMSQALAGQWEKYAFPRMLLTDRNTRMYDTGISCYVVDGDLKLLYDTLWYGDNVVPERVKQPEVA